MADGRIDRPLGRHLDRRRLLRALLLAGAGTVLPTGCGIPTGGAPVVHGTGPAYDPIGSAKAPPDPDAATSPKGLVELFLSAVSGQLTDPDSVDAARRRAATFLTPQAQSRWKAELRDQVVVVRAVDLTSSTSSGGSFIVSGTLQPVGVLAHDRGAVDPYPGDTAAWPSPVQFTVTGAAGNYRISDFPPALPNNVLPLAVDALSSYYTPQLIYFWDSSKSWLVPELRYVPRTVAPDVQLTQIVDWLLPALTDGDLTSMLTTNLIPSGTNLVGRVLLQNGDVTVPFSPALQQAKGPDLDKILAQVQWSLQPLHRPTEGPVELQIGGQKQQLAGADKYRGANLAGDAGGRMDQAQLFYVMDRTVRPYSGVLPAVLSDPDLNRDVVTAALSRDGQSAAVVTTGNRLVLGRTEKGSPATIPVDGLRGTTWSRPVWLPTNGRLLVAVDGQLREVSAAGTVSAPLATGVTAFAVSPDGFRIALVRGGVLQVAALDLREPDQPALGQIVRSLDVGLAAPGAVAWSRPDRLIVAGTDAGGAPRLTEIGVDGAIREPWSVSFVKRIVWIAAYAKPAAQVSGPGEVLVQTAEDNTPFHVYGQAATQGVQLPSPDTAVPGASPSGPAAQHWNPTAPFFPD